MVAIMDLVQILLPLYDRRGRKIPRTVLRGAASCLAEEYGGVTAYTRSPALGMWRAAPDKLDRDEVVVYEVMVSSANKSSWAATRRRLEKAFRQDRIVVRAMRFTLI